MNFFRRTNELFCTVMLLLLFTSFSNAQTPVTDFDELQNALSSPTVTSVSFNTGSIDFTGNLYSLYSRTVSFTASQPPVTLDGNSAYRGFTAYNYSNLSFNSVAFTNMKTPSLFNTSSSNYGGALYLSYSYATISGRSSFSGNQAVTGGAAYTEGYTSLTFSDSISFYGNKATLYGGALAVFNSYAYINGGGYFQNNSAATGGAAYLRGGYLYASGTTNFNNNSAKLNGGALAGDNFSTYYFYGPVNIQNNAAEEKGGGFYLNNSDAEFFSAADISNNNALLGGGFAIENNSVVSFDSATVINNNSASLNGGGFYSNYAITVFWDSIQMNNNTASGKGGGLYAVNDSLILGYGQSTITNNTAHGDGGGFYAGNASGVSFGESLISNNRSYGSGGGFASDASEVYFDHEADFVSNHASGNGGGFSAVNGSEVTFDSDTNFTGNYAGQNGGAFYSDASNIIFNSDVIFDRNISNANGGGFAAANSSKTNFNFGAAFTGNSALISGGAVALGSGSSAAFYGNPSGSYDLFEENVSSLSGGAVSLEDAVLRSYAAATVFRGNIAGQNGGAVYLNGSNAVASYSGSTSFNANSALNGGAIYVNSSNNLMLQGTGNVFDSNSAANAGGAFFSDNSIVNLSGSNSFTDNSAVNYGGAAAVTNSSSFDFGNGVSFTGNSAAAGGALFVDSSDVYLLNPVFSGNTANLAGGAVYLQGSQTKSSSLSVKVTTGSAVFSSNTAGGKANALHIGDHSSVNFNAVAGTSVEMHDGITSGHTDVAFTHSGEGDFNFYGDASGNFADMTISAQNGAAFNLKSGAKLSAGNFHNTQDSVFNMKNSQPDTVNVVNFNNDGILNMEVFSALNASDAVTAADSVSLGAASILNLDDDFTDRNFRSKTFKLINYGGNLSGTFGTVNFNSSIVFSTSPAVNYGDFITDWITVTYRGDLNTTNFGYLSGLSFNQKQTAKTFDALSASSTGDLDNVISAVEAGSESEIKKALAESSGYFLANVIRSAASGSENKEIYDRIKNHCSYGHLSGGLWAQFDYNSAINFSDKNSLNDYKDNSSGVTAGYDMYNNGKVIGVYGKYADHDIKQDPKNEAEIAKAAIGIYGGIIKYNWEVKANINGSYDSISADRYIPFVSRTAKADFNATTFGADVEGALKYKLAYNFDIRPFMGFEIKKAQYGSFSEKQAGSLNLDVKEGDYIRSAARIGIGTVYEKKLLAFYVNGEFKYLLSENYPEITSKFEDTAVTFKSRGAAEGRAEIGASAGASLRITEPFKVFANTSLFAAEDYGNFYINLGVRYNFCNLMFRKEAKPNTTADGFTYAPPPDFTDYSPFSASSATAKEKKTAAAAPDEKKLSEEFFDSILSEINRSGLSEDMQKALSVTNPSADQSISIELIKIGGENGLSESEGNKTKIYTLSMSNFVTNKAVLTEKAKKNLIFIANEIMNTDYRSVQIEGHTDSTGDDDINSRLSKERAKSVFDVLAQSGIPSEKMRYLGLSSKKPVTSNDTAQGRAKNRRVEIIIE